MPAELKQGKPESAIPLWLDMSIRDIHDIRVLSTLRSLRLLLSLALLLAEVDH
jgi:hypothetical protein